MTDILFPDDGAKPISGLSRDGPRMSECASATTPPELHEYVPPWTPGDNEVHRASNVMRPVSSMGQQSAIILCACFAMLGIVWLMGTLAATSLGVPVRYVYYFWAMFGLAVLVVLVQVGTRAYMKAVKFKRQKLNAAETWRVAIIGRSAYQEDFGVVPTENFEPIVVPARVGHRSKKQFVAVAAITEMVCFLSVLYFLPIRTVLTVASNFYLLMILGVGVSSVVTGFLYPVYYRVLPGSIDIVRYPFLGMGKPAVERFDLHACRVTVLAQRKIVLIDDPAVPPKPIEQDSLARSVVAHMNMQYTFHAAAEINVALNRDSMQLVRMIAAAAISPYPTPELPDDELVG
ncbi:MAG: hypothetical protein H6815_06420 [Phycisphaeraceae bacterium]|nr:hypothetical protein [Phycisphaerales bacterium]MCB9860074.1 hypothetical protein [Phycisphaeraceae bacterium]